MQKKRLLIILGIIAILYIINPIKSLATENTNVTNNFQDENLRTTILEIIRKVTNNESKQTITLEDIDTITADTLPSGKQLNLAGKNISNLAGLELFANKGIEWIYLDWNEISDISVLSQFNTLTKISASGNQITDISSLTNLKNLQNINFSNNQITDIKPILNLSNLKYLSIDNNQIQDITGISKLTNIKELAMAGNKLINCNEITQINTLENLDISRNQITTINQIGNNTSMTRLNLNYNKLTTLEGIENLTNLQILSASNNKIVDISSLSTLTKLYNLNLNKNEIENIDLLQNNTTLEYVYLDANHIISTESIEQLQNLKKVTLYNQICYLEITEEYEGDQIKINLTSLFQSLKNPNSKLYQPKVIYRMENNISYTIADDISYLILNIEDLKSEDQIFWMEDKNYTYLSLVIHYKVKQPENTNTIQNEIEQEKPSIQPDNKLQSTMYQIDNTYIKQVGTQTTKTQFIKNITNSQSGTITRNKTNLKEEDIIATGDILTVQNKRYTIIVKADPSGDGKTSIMDLMKIKRHITGTNYLDTNQILASDLNEDGKVTIIDAMRFVRIITK